MLFLIFVGKSCLFHAGPEETVFFCPGGDGGLPAAQAVAGAPVGAVLRTGPGDTTAAAAATATAADGRGV